MNCDNIASKNFNHRKKIESTVQIIIASYYHIALSLRNNYRKMSAMRLSSLVYKFISGDKKSLNTLPATHRRRKLEVWALTQPQICNKTNSALIKLKKLAT